MQCSINRWSMSRTPITLKCSLRKESMSLRGTIVLMADQLAPLAPKTSLRMSKRSIITCATSLSSGAKSGFTVDRSGEFPRVTWAHKSTWQLSTARLATYLTWLDGSTVVDSLTTSSRLGRVAGKRKTTSIFCVSQLKVTIATRSSHRTSMMRSSKSRPVSWQGQLGKCVSSSRESEVRNG